MRWLAAGLLVTYFAEKRRTQKNTPDGQASRRPNWMPKREAIILLFESAVVKKLEETRPDLVNEFVNYCLDKAVIDALEDMAGPVNTYSRRLFGLWLEKKNADAEATVSAFLEWRLL